MQVEKKINIYINNNNQKSYRSFMKVNSLLLLLLIAAITGLSGCGGDSADNIEQTQKKLRIISQAINMFKSEKYFGKPPESLKDLYEYRTTYYNIPEKNSVYTDLDKSSDTKKDFIKSTESYSLIPNKRVFIKSGLDKEEEEELAAKQDFITDFEFLPDYKLFQPKNTIIAWDKPGNFKTGGNILFEDGQVKFIKAKPKEYERFTTALKTQTDRDFIRDICIKNDTDCSLANIKKENPTASKIN